jgi:hypothetical protein
MLIFAYLFGLVPSFLYAVMMELWFRVKLRMRFGLFCTAGLSSFLGAGAGFLACRFGTWCGPLIGEHSREYVLRGAAIGLLVGFYVGRKQTSAACRII